MTFGIKRLIIDDSNVQLKSGTCEIKPSGAIKTPVLDDGTGQVMFFTQEKTAGMLKAQLSFMKLADTDKYRTLEDAQVVLEFLDGKTAVGTNVTQTADNAITSSDGVVEYEFTGDFKIK